MAILKTDLEKLYLSGKSMHQISQNLKCSASKIVYWMKKYNIKRRNRSDANYLLYNPNGDPFNLTKLGNLSKNEMFLYGLGIGLYWGEGDKTTNHAIRLANTDPQLIKGFRDFLINICRFESSRIYYSLICFNDTDPNTVRNYWSNQLKISPNKFGKITQIPKQGKGTYKRKSLYGVCILYAGNIKLKRWIMSEIEKLESRLVSSTVEQGLGKTQTRVRLSH